LRELLARVHERLSASGSVDREARALLARSCATSSARSRPVRTRRSPMSRGWKTLAVQFEAGHPGLAELLRQLIDALGKAGI